MPTKKTPLHRATVFLIDDESSWLQAISGLLKQEGFRVIASESGEDALTKLKKQKPDLILSDVRMPVMNGFDFYEQVKSNPALASVPFVFMSSIGDFDAKKVARELGADDYVEKPYNTGEMKSIVRDLFSRFKNRGTV